MKIINVMQVPGGSVQVEAPDDATVAKCVEIAGKELSGFSVSLSPHADSGNVANHVPVDGTTICLTRQVKGA